MLKIPAILFHPIPVFAPYQVIHDSTAWPQPNAKHEIPAYAEAASRRQAKFETNSNDQNPNDQNELDNTVRENLSKSSRD
jgi:hypothetical protein